MKINDATIDDLNGEDQVYFIITDDNKIKFFTRGTK